MNDNKEEKKPEAAKEKQPEAAATTPLISMTNEQLMEILKAKGSGVDEATLRRLAKALRPDLPDDVSYNEKEIDREDYLDEPVSFYAPVSAFTHLGEKRYGKQVHPPHGPIKFTPLMRRYVGDGSRKQVQHISETKVYLKSVRDFLRSSPLLGIKFFESTGGAIDFDRQKSMELQEAYGSLSGLEQPSIRSKARDYGIQNWDNGDFESVRHQLVEAIAAQNRLTAAQQQYRSRAPLVSGDDIAQAQKGDASAVLNKQGSIGAATMASH